MARRDINVFTALVRACGFRKMRFDRCEDSTPAMRTAQKDAASLWGKAGRARTGLGRGGVGM
jgi:hypothetical protein